MNVAVERKNRSPLAEPLPESEPLGLIKKTEFLLEVGTEEIPATMVSGALEALKQRFIDAMRNARLDYGPVRMFSTPRRFILHCAAVPERQDDIVEQVMGPSRKVAFDAQNKPTRALQGFLQKNQMTADSVEIVSTPKGEYVACRRYVAGLPAMSVLSDLLPPLILSIPFPKSMYWRMPEERFVRPIHYVVALLGREVVPFVVAGVKSGRSTAGHPIMAPLVFPVHSFVELKNKLADHFVLIDADERREIIQAGLHSEVPSGLMVVQDAALLEEVIHLIEYPQVMLGNFEREFLQLPEEVLTTVLRKHQKYFAVSDAQGKIQPHFLTVLNTASTDREKIRVGHQRVLRARLQDAGFYRDFDRRRKLEERVALLEHVVFQKKLGSYADKIRRLDKLAQRLASLVSFDAEADLKAAARLCKTDLTTEMVKEFTELQGIVGGLYARDEGYPEAVWKGIYEHYMPVSSDGPIPKTAAGRLLSIADKVDTLCGFFGLGIIPTGSSDPFSLRRQCQAIVRIAVEANISFSLRELFRHSFGLLADRLDNGKYEEVEKHLFEFMDARVRHLFSEEGLQYDVINSVVEAGYDDLVDLHTRARAIQGIRKEPDFEAIATSFKRINNILAGNVPDDGNVSSEIFVEEAEKELYRELKTREPQIASAMDARNYYDALKGMAQMRPRLDTFFDKVLVMADDPKLRNNRLRLLRRISGLFSKVGDLSQIVVE
jgi:glycyl-tRNA synthetase beta chain